MGYVSVGPELLRVEPGVYVDAHWGILHEWGHNHQVGWSLRVYPMLLLPRHKPSGDQIGAHAPICEIT